MLRHPICQFNKIGNRQLLSSLGEETMLGTSEVTKDRTKRVANHLTALAKRGLNDLNEERLIAAKFGALVADESDHSRLYLRRRVECAFAYGKEVFAVGLRTGSDLKAELDAFLKAKYADGTMENLVAKYGNVIGLNTEALSE